MKTKAVFFSLSAAVLISACATTDDMLNKLTAAGSAEKPKWISEALVTEDKCNTFTFDNVSSFVKSYDQAKLAADAKPEDKAAALKVMETYTLASILVNRSQLCLAEALELKETTESLLKEKEILLTGTSMTKSQIEEHRVYSMAASQEIKTAIDKAGDLQPKQRETFTLGTATYFAGSYTTAEIREDIQAYAKKTSATLSDTKDSATNGGTLQSIMDGTIRAWESLGTAAKIMRNLGDGMDGHMKNLYQNSQFLLAYSKQQNLDLPPDATQLLSDTSWE